MNAQTVYTAWNTAHEKQKVYQREAAIARAVQAARRKGRWLEVRNAVARAVHRVADAIAAEPTSETSAHTA